MVPQGGGWIRFQLNLNKITPNSTTWYFNMLDTFVPYANSKGVNICFPLQFNSPGASYLQTLDPCFNTVNPGSSTAVYMDPTGSNWQTVINKIVKRYNGKAGHGSVTCWQIGNEEFDTSTISGCNRDYQGNNAGITVAAVAPLIAAAHPEALIQAPACRRTPSNGQHIINWFTNLFTKAGSVMSQVDALDFHYYRDDPTVSQDPSVPVKGGGTNQFPDVPSTAQELAMIISVARTTYGYTNIQIWNGETGWHLYSGTTGRSICCGSSNCANINGCCGPVTPAVYGGYVAGTDGTSVYDMMRTGGGNKVFVYSLDPNSAVNFNYSNSLCPDVTVVSNSQDSITQTIHGIYTYLTPYTMMQTYANNRPTWGATQTPIQHDFNTRLKLQSKTNLKNIRTRFNFQPPGATVRTKDMHSRLVLEATSQKDVSSRLNLTPWLVGQKYQMALVYDNNGNFIDVWRDAPLLAGFKEAVNSAISPMQVQLPRSFDNYDLVGQPGSRGTIAQGNVVKYYLYGPNLPPGGLLRYQGIIDAFQPQITEAGEESIVVTLTPQSSAVADRGIATGVAFGQVNTPASYVDPIAIFNYWFSTVDFLTGHSYLAPLTLDPNNPLPNNQAVTGTTSVQYTFVNQTIKSIFDTLLLMLPPNWFYRANPDLSMTLNVAPVTAQHTFVVGQHLTSPSYTQDWTQLKNVVYAKGSGSLTAVRESVDIDQFGERLLLFNDTRVADQATLGILAQGLLNALDQMQLRTTLRIIDYRGDVNVSLGYDIETLKVGDTCTIIDPTFALSSPFAPSLWGTANWDDTSGATAAYWTYVPSSALNQITVISALTYNFDYVDVELSSLQPNQDAQLLRLRQRLEDFTLGSVSNAI